MCGRRHSLSLIADTASLEDHVMKKERHRYFASAAVAVDSSHMTVSYQLHGVDSVRLQILLTSTC